MRVIEHEDYEAQADDPSPPHPSHTHNTTDDYDDDDGVDDDRGYDDGDGDVDEEDDHVHGYVLEDSKEVLDGNKVCTSVCSCIHLSFSPSVDGLYMNST